MDYINTSEIVKEDIVKKSLAHWREYLCSSSILPASE